MTYKNSEDLLASPKSVSTTGGLQEGWLNQLRKQPVVEGERWHKASWSECL